MSRPPFTIRDLGEIAIRVRDMDAMFAFYRDTLGLEVLRPPTDGIAFFRIGAGHAGHTKVLALFSSAAGRPAAPSQGSAPPATGPRSSLHHIALNIDFAAQDAAVDWYRSQGLDPQVQRFDWIGWRGVFVTDPDGNTVELVAKNPDWIAP
ncbi:MAG: VOC family protein [Pseudomonadota bacterium]